MHQADIGSALCQHVIVNNRIESIVFDHKQGLLYDNCSASIAVESIIETVLILRGRERGVGGEKYEPPHHLAPTIYVALNLANNLK